MADTTCREQRHNADCSSPRREEREECTEKRVRDKENCVRGREDRREVCTRFREDTERRCTGWSEERTQQCTSWGPFSWLCAAAVWVVKKVCQGFVWVTDKVCVATTEVIHFTCLAWGWIVEKTCHLISYIVEGACIFWVWLVWIGCSFVEFVINTPSEHAPHAMQGSRTRRVPGRADPSVRTAWSFAGGINPARIAEQRSLKDTGVRIEYGISSDGQVWMRAPDADPSIAPQTDTRLLDFRSHVKKRGGEDIAPLPIEMIAASGDRLFAKAQGVDRFFMLHPVEVYGHVNQNGRALTLPQSFFQLDPQQNQEDPALGLIPPRGVVMMNLIRIRDGDQDTRNDDDELHLATERFPFFRWAYVLLDALGAATFHPKVAAALNGLRLLSSGKDTFDDIWASAEGKRFEAQSEEGARFGLNVHHLLDQVPIIIQNRTLTEIDCRPPMRAAKLPKKFRKFGYDHVTYTIATPVKRVNFLERLFKKQIRQSIGYTRALDLGVGLSHLHEQYTANFGGEMDCLLNQDGDGPLDDQFVSETDIISDITRPVTDFARNLILFALGVHSDEIALNAMRFIQGQKPETRIWDHRYPFGDNMYRFANGPIRDIGGWVDGTVIYYKFVQLIDDAELDRRTQRRDPGRFKDAFAVLWADEQFAFTERWRALHPSETEYLSPFKPMVGIGGPWGKAHESPYFFDRSQFFCPLSSGYIRAESRMSVTRQIVALSGEDPNTGRKEIYTIHWGWPTHDRTWRWRAAPHQLEPSGATSDLTTLKVWEDGTLSVSGTKRAPNAQGHLTSTKGVYVQHYLPADHREYPGEGAFLERLTDLPPDTEGSKPNIGYPHGWDFVSEKQHNALRDNYSHWGVLEEVDSRSQFYTLDPSSRRQLATAEVFGDALTDTDGTLTITRVEMNFGAAFFGDLKQHEIDQFASLDWLGAMLDGDPGEAERLINQHRLLQSNDHPSLFNADTRLALRDGGHFGPILVWDDKRDDKSIGLDRIAEAVLGEDPNEDPVLVSFRNERSGASHSIGIEQRFANPRLLFPEPLIVPPPAQRAKLRYDSGNGIGAGQLAIEITAALRAAAFADEPYSYIDWLKINFHRVKYGVHSKDGANVALDIELHDAIDAADRDGSLDETGTFTLNVPFEIDGLPPMRLRDVFDDRLLVGSGHSVWITGVTGLARRPDEVVLEANDKEPRD